MAGYKRLEYRSAVSRYVSYRVRTKRHALGPINQDHRFGEVMEFFSSTLTYNPNAIYYLIFLATNRLNVQVNKAIEEVEDVEEAIEEVGKRTSEVTRTTLLGDASAALLTVDRILTSRNAISSRAYSRYVRTINSFIRISLSPNIRRKRFYYGYGYRYIIARPPQLARTEVITALKALSSAYTTMLSTLDQVRAMLDEFRGLNLGARAIQGSVQKVRRDLRDMQRYFDNSRYSRDNKIARCRASYLSLAAGKAVLANYATVRDPKEPRVTSTTQNFTGVTAPPIGSKGALVSAIITCTRSAPWAIHSGINQLKVTADGGSEATFILVNPPQPSLTSFTHEAESATSYNIVAATNDKLEIDSLPVITLTAGASRTAQNIVDDINTWATGGSYPYLASVEVINTFNYIKITKTEYGWQALRMTTDSVVDEVAIKAAYTELGFYDGMQDTRVGVSAAEAAKSINDHGGMLARVIASTLGEGETGEVLTSTTFEAPAGVLSDAVAGDILTIRNGFNAGSYRIDSIVGDIITVISTQPFMLTGTGQDWIVLRELLQIESKAGSLINKLEIGFGSANAELGFTPGDTVVGTTTGFRATEDEVAVNFTRSDVEVGDIAKVKIGGVFSNKTVLQVVDDGEQLEVSPAFDADAVIESFEIKSESVQKYEEFVDLLTAWYAQKDASHYRTDIKELERVMNPLIHNTRPTKAQLNDARDAATELKQLLTNSTAPFGLTQVLVYYGIRRVGRMDAALKMLKERGLGRAYNRLTRGYIGNFFGMDKDDASYGGYMLKTVRNLMQNDLRVSKKVEDADDSILDATIRGTDGNFDYSDADADEALVLLGEKPSFSSAYQKKSRRWRY